MKTIIIDGIEYNLTPRVLFKKGDWITNGKLLVGQVTSFDGEYYRYMCDGFEQPLHVSNAHKWHLWTIQDAKDGDVLANKNGAIFINAGSDESRATLNCYCYISVQGEFCIEEHKTGSWLYKTEIYPATKEQRDTLFAKMKEAGYEWDAEKKELRKIEQKSSEWSEEDEKTIYEAISLINMLSSGYGEKVTEPITFNGVKMINDIKERLRNLHHKTNHWKPSEEQIQALKYEIESTSENSWQRSACEKLLHELEKL